MSGNGGILAIRNSVAVSTMDHVVFVRLGGDKVYEALGGIIAGELHIRDGQMIQSLLLAEDGRVFADVYLGCDGDDFFLLSEGPSAPELEAHLARHLHPAGGVRVLESGAGQSLVMLHGPYAWELLGLLAGPDSVSLPYLTFFHLERGICFRAGRTGEYGYGFLVGRDDAAGLVASLLDLGKALDVAEAGLEDLDQCALENWQFNIRREGREAVTPVELQLQWRVSGRKSYVGSGALGRRRASPPGRRLTCLLASGAMEVGSPVACEGRPVGRIVNSGYSVVRGDWPALALVDLPWAHPGIDEFLVEGIPSPVPARSVTPPLLNNRSLFVSPQIHSYATRHEFQFPPLARTW